MHRSPAPRPDGDGPDAARRDRSPRPAPGRGATRRSALTAGATALVGSLVLTGCGLAGGGTQAAAGGAGAGSTDRTITVVATDTPAYSTPLEIAAEILEADGWSVDITYVTDIVQPNNAVSNGEFDDNSFQHGAYLQTFNRDNGTDVAPLFYAVGSPAGICSTRHDDIAQLPDGASIALPVDPANNGRALHLLTQTLPDVDAGFLFPRQAIEMELAVEDDALLREEDADAIPYRIVFGGGPDEVSTEKTAALREAFQSEEVEAFYRDFYGDWAPLPWDEDPQEQLDQWWQE